MPMGMRQKSAVHDGGVFNAVGSSEDILDILVCRSRSWNVISVLVVIGGVTSTMTKWEEALPLLPPTSKIPNISLHITLSSTVHTVYSC